MRFSTLQIGYIVASAVAPMTGSERYFFDLVRALPGAGVGATGLVVGDPALRYGEVPVESFAPEHGAGRIARVAALRRAVRRLAPQADLITTHAPEHGWPVLDLAAKKPLVVHFHGPRVLELRAERQRFARIALAQIAETLTYARARRFIALSDANAAVLHAHYRVPERKIRIVPGAVDLERFTPRESREEARAALGLPAHRPIVVAVRRLAPTKGLEGLLEAVVLLRRNWPDVLVALVGAGPLRAALERRIADLGIDGNVMLTGQLDATLPLAYRAADLSIVPSVELEGFGLSALESLACGTPALVTPVTGLPEVVRALDPGLILRSSTPQALAEGLAAALAAPASLPSAAQCVAYAENSAWPSIVRRISAVYEEVL